MKLFGKWYIGKECSTRWFPRVGYGYWDGIRYFLKQPINLKPTLTSNSFGIGPLVIWKARYEIHDR